MDALPGLTLRSVWHPLVFITTPLTSRYTPLADPTLCSVLSAMTRESAALNEVLGRTEPRGKGRDHKTDKNDKGDKKGVQ